MVAIFYVFLGGGLGAVLRYASLALCKRMYAPPFPMGTLCVNVVGSLLMGALMAWVLRDTAAREEMRMLFAVGLLGGFTTFSAFSWDVLTLWQQGAIVQAMLYIAGSVLLSLIAVSVGYIIIHKGIMA